MSSSFYSTYEELKQIENPFMTQEILSFYSTYEELKQHNKP